MIPIWWWFQTTCQDLPEDPSKNRQLQLLVILNMICLYFSIASIILMESVFNCFENINICAIISAKPQLQLLRYMIWDLKGKNTLWFFSNWLQSSDLHISSALFYSRSPSPFCMLSILVLKATELLRNSWTSLSSANNRLLPILSGTEPKGLSNTMQWSPQACGSVIVLPCNHDIMYRCDKVW